MKTGVLPIPVDDDIDTTVREGAAAVGLKLADVMRQGLRRGVPAFISRMRTVTAERPPKMLGLPGRVPGARRSGPKTTRPRRARSSPPSMPARIADAGFIIALNSQEKRVRAWARGALDRWRAPFITKDQEMDLTDACIVRMSELFPDCRVFSVDGDFKVYRRFRDLPIPTLYPPAVG